MRLLVFRWKTSRASAGTRLAESATIWSSVSLRVLIGEVGDGVVAHLGENLKFKEPLFQRFS